nr:RNA-directed DNA polymerase, eukaryota [Tanacetum cinerariifolium]
MIKELGKNMFYVYVKMIGYGSIINNSYTDHLLIEWQGKANEFSSILGLLNVIDLLSNNLTGQIPNEVTNMHGLLVLDLSNNSLVGGIPRNIGHMKELLTLNLSRNKLSGEIPPIMSEMTLLNNLDMSFNDLSGRIPLGTQLQTFNASAYIGNAGLCGRPLPNKFSGDEGLGVPPVSESDGDGERTPELQRWFYIGGATGFATAFWIACSALLFNRRLRHAFFHFHNCLKDWVLSYNKFSGTIPISIGSLTKLTNLSLHGNNFSGVIPRSIGSLTKLTTLSLHGNNFSGVIPRSIGSLTKLTTLSFHGNNFSGVIPRSIGSLTKLTTLSLHGNNFSGVISRSIGSSTKLTNLSLHGNNFSGVIPRSIGSLTKLTNLSLHGNNFSGVIPRSIGSLTKLTTLSLHGNNFSGVIPRSIELNDINQLEAKNSAQKSKIQWAIEGDENSKFFHGIINKNRSILSIRGVFVNGSWCSDPNSVKDVFKCHFETRFKKPCDDRLKLNSSFDKRLSPDQLEDLDRFVSRDEISKAVWSCGDNKSLGPDGFTFEIIRKYWHIVGSDFCVAVEHFFDTGVLQKGCNSSFIALIPKVSDAKFVTDFRPICLIGCVYKVITKVLAIRLATMNSDLVSETQSAFVANRQILEGPFILNEFLNWCKRKRKQALFFKVYFTKAYDSVRWDYLLDVLYTFWFGSNWCRWIRGSLGFAKASILVNGSPTSEFPFYYGLKQGDPLAPFLFILIMESLHISFTRVVKDGLFKKIQLPGSVSISHIFYADDAMFIGEWSDSNLRSIIHFLKCFSLASGMNINIQKSQVQGVGVPHSLVEQAVDMIGCFVLSRKFCYLGVMVGESMSRKAAWVDTVHKIHSRLSKWKTLEAIRSNFFNGADSFDRKITWVAWDKVLASKRNGGLGVSSLYALNRALLLKWVSRFISMDGSLWFKVILAMYGPRFEAHLLNQPSIWCSILRRVRLLNHKGFDFLSHSKKRVGDGRCTSFWEDIWIFGAPLRVSFPRLYALELNKQVSVAEKLVGSVTHSPSKDRWSCELSGDEAFKVKVVQNLLRNLLDDMFLPSQPAVTRWMKYISIKVNIFAWRARQDCLPTRSNLSRRGVVLDSTLCPQCSSDEENIHHVLFKYETAKSVMRKICRWWDLA